MSVELYGPMADAAADHYGVPRDLVRAVIGTESSWNPKAVSPKGAQGLMQIMPETAKTLGVDPFDPVWAIDGGVRYLKEGYDKAGGDWMAALNYYVSGKIDDSRAAGIYRQQVIDRWRQDQATATPAEAPPVGPQMTLQTPPQMTPQTAPTAAPPQQSSNPMSLLSQGLQSIVNIGSSLGSGLQQRLAQPNVYPTAPMTRALYSAGPGGEGIVPERNQLELNRMAEGATGILGLPSQVTEAPWAKRLAAVPQRFGERAEEAKTAWQARRDKAALGDNPEVWEGTPESLRPHGEPVPTAPDVVPKFHGEMLAGTAASGALGGLGNLGLRGAAAVAPSAMARVVARPWLRTAAIGVPRLAGWEAAFGGGKLPYIPKRWTPGYEGGEFTLGRLGKLGLARLVSKPSETIAERVYKGATQATPAIKMPWHSVSAKETIVPRVQQHIQELATKGGDVANAPIAVGNYTEADLEALAKDWVTRFVGVKEGAK